MKILKKFDSYIKENIELTEEEPKVAQTLFTGETDDELAGEFEGESDEEIEAERQASVKDETEEEDTYIGTKMLNDLAKALDTEVVDGAVMFDGKKINFFSETEKFHVDKKKFDTVEDVVAYLTGEKSNQAEIQKMEADLDEMSDEVEELEDVIEEEEEEIAVRRYVQDFDEDEFEEDDEEEFEFEFDEDEMRNIQADFDSQDTWKDEEECEPCGDDNESDWEAQETWKKMRESKVTKRFKDFK